MGHGIFIVHRDDFFFVFAEAGFRVRCGALVELAGARERKMRLGIAIFFFFQREKKAERVDKPPHPPVRAQQSFVREIGGLFGVEGVLR